MYNDTGKSTLLKIIAGLETPDRGHVQVGGSPSSIGYLKQEFSTNEETLTVADFVSSQSHLDLKEHYKIKIVMDGLDFPYRRWEDHISSLSGGQKSKLLLSVVLLNANELILLDEPTNSRHFKTFQFPLSRPPQNLSNAQPRRKNQNTTCQVYPRPS